MYNEWLQAMGVLFRHKGTRRTGIARNSCFTSICGTGAVADGTAEKVSVSTNIIETYLQRILQKHPKLLPLGTSPAYDIVMFGTA